MNSNASHGWRRALAGLVAFTLAVGPGLEAAHAALTELSDIPIASKVTAKPNILYTLDDSGSMTENWLPDYVVSGAPAAHAITLPLTQVGGIATAQVASTAALSAGMTVLIAGAAQPAYNGIFSIAAVLDATHFTYAVVGNPPTAGGAPTYTIGSSYCRSGTGVVACNGAAPVNAPPWNSPPFLDADFNHLEYNPNITYTAPAKYDGTFYSDETAALTTNFTRVQPDPFLTPATFNANLVATVGVPVYCNTDWPLLNNDTATTSSLQLSDIGDAHGEHAAGAGAWCRINGTQYDASGASGAPAVIDDYNYPWQNTAGPNDPKYFYRNLGNKTVWCDQTSPYYPRNGAAPTSCGTGTTITGAPRQQSCVRHTAQCNPVVASRNYTPATCKTPADYPLYCVPNTGGSDGNSLGTGTLPECSACTCNADYTAPGGTCSIIGNACTGPYGVLGGDLAECPNQPGVVTGCTCIGGGQLCATFPLAAASCPALMWDPTTNQTKIPNTTLLSDSQNAGQVCRHNNRTYAVGGVAGLFKYPGTYLGDVSASDQALGMLGKFLTGVACAGMNVASTIAIPRHYYTVDSVQFCNNQDLTVNDQWKGFGTGVCQSKNDFSAHVYVKYGQFHRIDLVNDGRTFAYTDAVTGLAGTRTWGQEMVNYSNWYAYYRTRVLAAKTTTATAFSFLDSTYRVGFHTLNTPSTYWIDVKDWLPGAGNQRNLWYNSLFSVVIGNKQTPSIDALLRVGEFFRNGAGGQGGLPNSTLTQFPEGYIPATATDPVTVSCQKNFHIFFTDGFTNQPAVPSFLPSTPNPPTAWGAPYAGGEVDGQVVPTFPADPDPINHPEVTVGDLRALTGSAWPAPYLDTIPTANTLADVSLFYWMHNLRPAAQANGFPVTNVPSNDGRIGADLVWTNDPAFWQHLNFSAISFGSEGVLDATNAVNVTNAIAAGTQQWFTAPNIPNPPNNPVWPSGNKGATAVDDLWHATVNARGVFVYAQNPLQVSYGLGHILAGIQNQEKSRAGSAFSSNVLTVSNHAIFEPTIEPGWSGDLKKVEIDPTTAVQGAVDWDALALLNTLLATPAVPPASDSLYPWFASRRVVAWNPTSAAAVPFLYANLTAAQLATLGGTAGVQHNVIAYLRGGSVSGAPMPKSIEGTAIGQFRQRQGGGGPGGGKLGDISDSAPLVINPPNSPWFDSTDPGYSTFVTNHAARLSQVYVGANDGMLHVFDALSGAEDFAYIPGAVFTSAVDQDGAPKGIQALTYQDGGAPHFKHHFYVDGSPRTSDVDFGNTGGSIGGPDWHTIVVGGLGKGGNSIYAIDATVPVATTDTEATAASKVLWEFTDADMQFSFSAPIIAKTRADGWVVMVANGYDAPSGKGKIYVINAKTGTLIRTLTTTAADPGSPASPSGLGQISGFTQDFHNQIVEQVYGGDLNGNVWRWDVSDPAPGNWKTVLFAQLTDPSGVVQPVTTAPQIEIDLNNATDRWVFVGTGRLLHGDDLTNPSPEQIETMYAIRDGSLTQPVTAGLPIAPRVTLAAANALTTGPIGVPAPNGWFMDLPLGQRIVTNPEADLNVVVFVGTQAQPDPCLTSLPAFVYGREFTSAESDILDSTATLVASAYSPQGAVGIALVALVNPLSPFPTLAVAITQETNASIKPFNLQPKSFTGSIRMSWRLLGD